MDGAAEPLVSDEDHGRQRLRAARRGGLTSLGGRAVSLAAGFATLPLALDGLGRRDFGVFLAVSSAVTLLGFTNLGIGQGLVATVARAQAREDTAEIQRLVSTAMALLTAVALAGVAVVLVAFSSAQALSATEPASWLTAAALAAVLVLLGLPLTVAASVRLGLQESAASNAWTSLTGVFQLAGVTVAWLLDAGLVGFVCAFVGAGLVAGAGDSVMTLMARREWLRPRRSAVRRSLLSPLLRTGSLFFVLALAGTVAFNVDTLIVAAVLGPEAAAQYGVAFKLFTTAPLLAGLFLTPLWPAYSDAAARGDEQWTRRVLTRSLLASIAFNLACALALLALTRELLRLWLGTDLGVPTGLLLALACHAVVIGASTPLAMYLNGVGVVRFQVVIAVVMAVVNLPLSIVLAQRIGVAGPAWGTVVAQLLAVLLPCAVFVPRHLRLAQARSLQV
jgi:O-antigen/teichoic acid export membrane protein